MNNTLVAKLLWLISQDLDLVAASPAVRALNTQMKDVKDSTRITVLDVTDTPSAYWYNQYTTTAQNLKAVEEESNAKISKLEMKIQRLESQKAVAKANVLMWKREYFSIKLQKYPTHEEHFARMDEWADEWDKFLLKQLKAEKWERLQSIIEDDE